MPRWLKGVAAGLMVSLAGGALLFLPFGAEFERQVGLPALFALRGAVPPPPEVAVVAIDGRTGDELGLPSLPRDWPRSVHGRLVDELTRRGASVIVFDIHFGREKDPTDDARFVEAVGRSGRVVLVELLTGKRRPLSDSAGRHVGMVWEEERVPPFPALEQVAAGIASFPLPKAGASVAQFWAFKESTDQSPTLPAVALQLHAWDATPGLLALAEVADPVRFAALPALAEARGDAARLRHLMSGLHGLFVANAGRLGGVPAVSPATPPILPEQALEAMYAGASHRHLNFYGPPGTIRNVPYHAVLKGGDPNVPPEHLEFAGKVVFVGYSDLYDPGQPDRFYTVFTRDDGVDLSGVEIAATGFANLLTNRSLVPVDGLLAVALVLGIGFVLGAGVYLLPAIFGVPAALALAAAYGGTAYRYFAESAILLPLATPLLVQVPLALFIGLLGQYLLERRRGQRISAAINYYLPDEIARDLSQDRLEEGKLNRVVYSTCLATDMAGFSTIAEQMPPGELARFLNDYFETLAAPLKRHGVHVTEFRADAIMCAWTAEADGDPRPRREALAAALEAGVAIQEFKRRHAMPGAKLRIGLEAGWVYVGHAGGGGRFVYSIVGDSANTASRVEGLNKHVGTQILATGAVVAGFENLVTRYLGDFQFVGKTEATPIHEVVALRESATPEQISWCERFDEVMVAYRAGRWEEAAAGLARLAEEDPEDGPVRFFLERSRRFAAAPGDAPDPGVVRMDAK